MSLSLSWIGTYLFSSIDFTCIQRSGFWHCKVERSNFYFLEAGLVKTVLPCGLLFTGMCNIYPSFHPSVIPLPQKSQRLSYDAKFAADESPTQCLSFPNFMELKSANRGYVARLPHQSHVLVHCLHLGDSSSGLGHFLKR